MTTMTLISGDSVEIIQPRGMNYARAVYKYRIQKEYDVCPFLMEELVLINGEKKPLQFYLDMFCDDYIKISEKIAEIVTPIQ